MSSLDSAILFGQNVYKNNLDSIKQNLDHYSKRTIYRHLKELQDIGLAKYFRGKFQVSSVLSQPAWFIKELLPSIKSLKQVRRFGKYYNENDVKLVKKSIEFEHLTLDYKAWELTRYQNPFIFYIYVKNQEDIISKLKQLGFHEGMKGKIGILPLIGSFENTIERTHLDCIAHGGRSRLDAIAIEIIYGSQIKKKGFFSISDILQVQENLNV
jgi:hypothetical protein